MIPPSPPARPRRSPTCANGLPPTPARDPADPLPDDLAAVIITAAARLATNPGGLASKRVSELEITYARGAAGDWTLAERLAVDRWRVRTGSL